MNFYGLYSEKDTVLFLVSGCRYKTCAVPEVRDFSFGAEVTDDVVRRIIEMLPEYGGTLNICGGDIFEPENIQCAAIVINSIRRSRPNSKICVWSGHTVASVRDSDAGAMILLCIDTLIGVDTEDFVPSVIDLGVTQSA